MTQHIGPGKTRVDGPLEVFDGNVWRVMPPTFDPLTMAIRQFIATNPAPCYMCGRYDCCCEDTTDPHGDLTVWLDEEIPY